MTAGTYNLTIEAGTTFSRTLTLRDSSNALINLTGYSARLSFRREYADASAAKEMTSGSGHLTLGGSAGTIVWAIPDDETDALSGTYLYDLEIESGGGVVTRVLQGTVTISPSVTK